MRFLLVVLAVLLAGALTTACGSSDDEPVVATVERTDRDRGDDRDEDPEPAVSDDQDDVAPTEPAAPDQAKRADSSPSNALLSPSARRAFAALSAKHPGTIGAALLPVGSTGEPESVGDLQQAVAWSTIKVPIAAAVLAAGASDRDRSDIDSALTVSDNAAAQRLWERLGNGTTAAAAVEAQLRRAGDDATRVQSQRLRPEFSAFGQTTWTLADQARFMAGIDCLAGGAQLRSTMMRVTSGQRWGLGTIGSSTPFKGGWGPGTDPGAAGGYLDRQVGIVTIDGREVAVAIAAAPSSGSHEAGTAALDAIAGWLVQQGAVGAVGRGGAATNCGS